MRRLHQTPRRRFAAFFLAGVAVGTVIAPGPAAAQWLRSSNATKHSYTRYGTWAPTCTAGSVTLNPSDDLYVNASNGATNGATLNVGLTSSGSSTEVRAFVQFSVPALAAGCAYTSAALTLRASGSVYANKTLEVQRIDSGWSEASAPAFAVGTSGAAVTTTCCASSSADAQWNVLSLMTQSGGAPNGFRVRMTTLTSAQYEQFRSRTNTVPPRLDLSWS